MEEKGFSTVTLTVSPEFNREIGIPRVAAIEYPYGRPVGQVNDNEGQTKVLLEALSVLENAQDPGQVFHLPFDWPEEPKDTKWHPPVASPMIELYLDEIRKAGAEARK
ncbi:MAG: hypothetical protein JSV50_16640 [Desulfobacteraceae bacterium]|nr:MAG: hypothetical protein JSV50_16640 [Desulfobacteraceae bacterium]